MAPKRKAEAGEEKEKKPSRARATKEVIEFHVGEDGWTIDPPSQIYRLGDADPGSKIAAFDLDGTLATVKSSAQFAINPDDYKLFNKKVPEIMQGLANDGYKIVIFSNQNGVKSALTGKAAIKVKQRIDNILRDVGVTADVFLATLDDEYRKPKTGMWDRFVSDFNGGVKPDLDNSFYVGDAAGRPEDFASSDKEFAEAVGIKFKTPEDVFGPGVGKKQVPMAAAKAGEGSGAASGPGPNQEMADAFKELAQNEEREGRQFQARAFSKVAAVLEAYQVKVTSGKEASKLAGIGKGSAAKIDQYLLTGSMEHQEEGGAPGGGAKGEAKSKAKKAEGVAKDERLKFL